MSIEEEQQQHQQESQEELEASLREQKITNSRPEPETEPQPLEPLIKEIKGGLDWYDDPKQSRNDSMIPYPATSKHFYIDRKVAPVVIPLIMYYDSHNISTSEVVCQNLIVDARKLVASKVQQSSNDNADDNRLDTDMSESEMSDGRARGLYHIREIELNLYELFKGDNWHELTKEEKVRAEAILSYYGSTAKKINDMHISENLHNDMLSKAKRNLEANRTYLQKRDLREKYDK